ncbi:MAG: glycosyltransferase 87 family protein [Anaerolineae bacterium]
MINVLRGHLRDIWRRSHFFRVVLVLSVGYTVLRILIQVGVLTFMFSGGMGLKTAAFEWAPQVEGPMIPDDLRIYLDAADRLQAKEALYIQGTVDRMEFYQYAPSFALLLIPLLKIPRQMVAILHTTFIVLAYSSFFVLWGKFFDEFRLPEVQKQLVLTLPVWLLFSSFWTDLGYLNVYIFMALLSSLALYAVMKERLWLALLWISLILQVKPQWAFALVIPLLMGRWRFFLKLLGLAVLSYFAMMGLTLLIVGPRYGWQQYVDYVQLLRGISAGGYPWRDPSMPFLGYNHSIKQVLVYTLGATPDVLRWADAIKLLLLLPLGVLSVRYLLKPVNERATERPCLALDLAFAFYLGAFLWLDMIWELSLSIVVFPYLWKTVGHKFLKGLILAVFLPYALLDPLRIGGLGLSFLGLDTITPGPYILTDPAIYLPLILFVAVVFYGVLVIRLWQAPHLQQSAVST